ncbi:MAG: glycoside hydrolase family 2, partial [Leptolyngbyaceae cyanobacterium MAG.088]|nr:glycoside hydrolase family 2 [Leptolyngbyaceae cyanobacterium MAG.088]
MFLGCLTATHPRLIANPHLFHAQAYWTPTVTQTVDQTSLAGTWEFQADPQPPADKLVLQPSGPDIPPMPEGQWQEIAVPSNWYLQGQDLSG